MLLLAILNRLKSLRWYTTCASVRSYDRTTLYQWNRYDLWACLKRDLMSLLRFSCKHTEVVYSQCLYLIRKENKCGHLSLNAWDLHSFVKDGRQLCNLSKCPHTTRLYAVLWALTHRYISFTITNVFYPHFFITEE